MGMWLVWVIAGVAFCFGAAVNGIWVIRRELETEAEIRTRWRDLAQAKGLSMVEVRVVRL